MQRAILLKSVLPNKGTTIFSSQTPASMLATYSNKPPTNLFQKFLTHITGGFSSANASSVLQKESLWNFIINYFIANFDEIYLFYKERAIKIDH